MLIHCGLSTSAARDCLAPGSERQTLERLALAITQGSEKEIDEREVWKLPREALGLLDALIERRIGRI